MSDTTATPDQAVTHNPCCSSHGVPMSCDRYRYTHFVEVGPCCAAWAKAATPVDVNADTGPKRRLAQVSVYCDSCVHTHSGDYLVRDSDDQATRFGYARAHLNREGWSCDERGDFCPRCLPIALDRKL